MSSSSRSGASTASATTSASESVRRARTLKPHRKKSVPGSRHHGTSEKATTRSPRRQTLSSGRRQRPRRPRPRLTNDETRAAHNSFERETRACDHHHPARQRLLVCLSETHKTSLLFQISTPSSPSISTCLARAARARLSERNLRKTTKKEENLPPASPRTRARARAHSHVLTYPHATRTHARTHARTCTQHTRARNTHTTTTPGSAFGLWALCVVRGFRRRRGVHDDRHSRGRRQIDDFFTTARVLGRGDARRAPQTERSEDRHSPQPELPKQTRPCGRGGAARNPRLHRNPDSPRPAKVPHLSGGLHKSQIQCPRKPKDELKKKTY